MNDFRKLMEAVAPLFEETATFPRDVADVAHKAIEMAGDEYDPDDFIEDAADYYSIELEGDMYDQVRSAIRMIEAGHNVTFDPSANESSDYVSNCCGAPFVDETEDEVDGMVSGICSACGEGAGAEEVEESADLAYMRKLAGI